MIIIIFYTFWCVLHYYTAWRPRGGDKIRPSPPPPWKIVNFLVILGAFLLLFLLCGSFCYEASWCFFCLAPPPPYENFCGRPCYTVSINFLVTLDTYAENKPTIDCLGGGVHGKVCWVIAYILGQWCVNGIGHSVAHCYNK